MRPTWIVALDDGETYGGAIGAVTLRLPPEVKEADELEEWVKENHDAGDPVVPYKDVLASVELSLQELGLHSAYPHVRDNFLDFVTNYYGVD